MTTELLKRRGGTGKEHPEPVTTTWSLSFEQVDRLNPMATDLLRVCAFLAPDAIPEELITQGAKHLGPVLAPVAEDPIALDEAMAALGAYSLVQRNPANHTLSIHRLVQAVLIEGMNQQTQHLWIERAIRAIDEAFPESGAFEYWETCSQYIPHVLVAFAHIKTEKMALPEAAEVLRRAGWYLGERGQHREAEELLLHAFQVQGPLEDNNGLAMAHMAIALGWLYGREGKYTQAEPLFLRALRIMEQQLGPKHHETSEVLNNLAALYDEQGMYEQAEPLYQRALASVEKQLGPEHPNTTTIRENYHVLVRNMKRKGKVSTNPSPP